MAKGLILRERGDFDASEALLEEALRIAGEQSDPETEGWTRGALSWLYAMRGELDKSLATALRNYELTERLGDVFSRQYALLYLGGAHLAREEPAEALEYLERADRLYWEAMDKGGEADGWRQSLIGAALAGVGRGDEGLERAERGVAILKERGLNVTLPNALRSLAKVRTAAAAPGATEALQEAERVGREFGLLAEADAAHAELEEVLAAS
jgi:tetratricopeptide (TPR) repeat protein